MDAQQFAEEVVAELKAIGFDAVAKPYEGAEPGAYAVSFKSTEYTNIPLGPCPTAPNGGVMTGVPMSVIAPQAPEVSGYTAKAWAASMARDALREVAMLKALYPTLGQGVFVNSTWYASEADVPAPDAPPVPYVAPPVRPGGIPTPFGYIYPPEESTPITATKERIQRWLDEGKALFGL